MVRRTKNNPFIVLCFAVYTSTSSMAVSAEDILPIDCMIEPNIMVEISSPVDGVLDTLLVDRSDEVKKGQVIATLKSEVEQVAVDMSLERLKLARSEYKRAKGLYRKKVITITEKDRLDNEKKLAELNLKHARANLDLRKIKSPIDGVVVNRYSSPGEFVEADPIIKMVQLDPLKIEVFSPVSNYGKIVNGMKAEIVPDSGAYQDLIAEVVVVDKVIDAASGTFGIRLELANKDNMIPSGLKCTVRFMSEGASETIRESAQVAMVNTTTGNDISTEQTIIPTPVIIEEELLCLTVGPYKEQITVNDFIAELDSDIQHSALRTDIAINTTYLVTSELFSSLEETKSIMQSMKKSGFKDIAILGKDGSHRLALGMYRRQSYAEERVKKLQDKGYKVLMKPVKKEINSYWADVAFLAQSATVLNDVIPETQRNGCDEVIKTSLLN